MVGAGVHIDGVAHHFGGDAVGEAEVDCADGPGMAEVVGGKGNAVTPKLGGDALTDALEGGGGEVGGDLGKDDRSQVEAIDPFGGKGPDGMAASFGSGEHLNLSVAGFEFAVVAIKNFVVAQSEGGHDAVDRSPSGVGDFFPVLQNGVVVGEFANFAGAIVGVTSGFREKSRFEFRRDVELEKVGEGTQGSAADFATAGVGF